MNFRSGKRLYVNADKSKIVEEDSPEAAYLLVGEGGTVTDEMAKQYNLKAPRKSEKDEDEDDEPKREAESKQVAEPPENKAQTMRSGKDK